MSVDANADDAVVRLRELGKVFVTEKIETHALADVSLAIGRRPFDHGEVESLPFES